VKLGMDLQDIERRTYLSFFQDGIADLTASLVILLFGLGMTTGSSTLFTFAWMPMLLFWPLKRRISYPRIGYVRFAPERQRKISVGLGLMVLAGVFSLMLGIFVLAGVENNMFNLGGSMREYSLLILALLLAAGFTLIAILFEVWRFIMHGVVVFAGFLTGYLFDIPPGTPVAIAGGMITLIGLGLLVRFLARYPRE
jgi:hypothetical protein